MNGHVHGLRGVKKPQIVLSPPPRKSLATPLIILEHSKEVKMYQGTLYKTKCILRHRG